MVGAEECVPLSEHDMLEPDECREIRDLVLRMKPRWTTRGEGSFYTLGTASYLDAPGQPLAYVQAAQATNPLLGSEFGWVQERILAFFEDLLGERTYFDNQYALPGFHIFKFGGEDRSRERAASKAHFDLQWMSVIPGQGPGGTLSFTIPIEQPSGGSCMEVWTLRYREAVQLQVAGYEYAQNHPSQRITYKPGRVVVHDGLVLHAIGNSSLPAPKGYRITLQGHGARLAGKWLLYW